MFLPSIGVASGNSALSGLSITIASADVLGRLNSSEGHNYPAQPKIVSKLIKWHISQPFGEWDLQQSTTKATPVILTPSLAAAEIV